MEDALQRIEQKIDLMAVELTAVAGGLASVQGEVTGLRGAVLGLDGEVTGLKGEMTTVKGALAAVETRLGSVEGGLTQLTETVHQQGLRQEYLIDKVTATMEGLDGGRQATAKRFDEVMAKLDERVQPIEMATRYLATKKPRGRS